MIKIKRNKTRVINVGGVRIGGDNPVVIQSMTKYKTSMVDPTLRQIAQLEKCGCQVVRLAIKDESDALALKKIKEKANIPLVADIHFDYRLGLLAIDSGVDKVRLNPGNIYKPDQVREVVAAAKANHIPIRVGANSGSLRDLGNKKDFAGKMVKSVLDYIRIIEKCGFFDIAVSLKASNILDTLQSYRLMAKSCDYPMHLGLTATGSPYSGVIKSSILIGSLLAEGIGDTIRVSLTDKPQEEVRAARQILQSLGLSGNAWQIISCPTCGRCEVDLVGIVKDLEKNLVTLRDIKLKKPMEVAVMGCVVNGPGEARDADIGIAFGAKEGLLFRRGRTIKKIPANKCVRVLLEEIVKFK